MHRPSPFPSTDATGSHVFCSNCADATGLSRTSNASRVCPACGTQLINPDDVVAAGLQPSEDYKTSVLSGLSPSIIMDCASRGLAFYSYQASQEIIYQEHLAKSLTEKYSDLNQQMDTLINDANVQIKGLQERIQSKLHPCTLELYQHANTKEAMHMEQESLEKRNEELVDAYKEKNKAQQQLQKRYQSLKAQVMATQVVHAAGDEANFTVQTARGNRFVDRLPGARTGTANLNQVGSSQHHGGGRQHNRGNSGSSGSSGQQQQRGGIGLAPPWNSQLQNRGLGRMHTRSEFLSLVLRHVRRCG